jgi:hypothetical protein
MSLGVECLLRGRAELKAEHKGSAAYRPRCNGVVTPWPRPQSTSTTTHTERMTKRAGFLAPPCPGFTPADLCLNKHLKIIIYWRATCRTRLLIWSSDCGSNVGMRGIFQRSRNSWCQRAHYDLQLTAQRRYRKISRTQQNVINVTQGN